jgi:hypothetical protein
LIPIYRVCHQLLIANMLQWVDFVDTIPFLP